MPETYTLFVLAGIIILKEIMYRFVKTRGQETHSSALKAEAMHHRSDAFTSLAALLGISIALILGKGYEAADDWAALLAAALILYNSYNIFRPALGEIMDEHVYDELISTIKEVSKKETGVIDTEKCFIRKTGMKYQVDLHIIVNGNISVKDGHDIAHNLQDRLLKEIPEIAYVLIHVEPDV